MIFLSLTHVWVVCPAPSSCCCWSSPNCCKPSQSHSGASGSSRSWRRRPARSALLSLSRWSSAAGLEIRPHSRAALRYPVPVRGKQRRFNTATIATTNVSIRVEALYLKQQGDFGLGSVWIVLENPPEVGAAFRSCVRDREPRHTTASTSVCCF